jgi:cold shock protein
MTLDDEAAGSAGGSGWLAKGGDAAHLIDVGFVVVRAAFPTRVASAGPALRSVSSLTPPFASSGGTLSIIRTKMAIGTVKWLNSQKGYGFIQPEDGSKDVFVHISAVERSGMGNLHEGQRLSFELERGNQGKTLAVHLRQA